MNLVSALFEIVQTLALVAALSAAYSVAACAVVHASCRVRYVIE